MPTAMLSPLPLLLRLQGLRREPQRPLRTPRRQPLAWRTLRTAPQESPAWHAAAHVHATAAVAGEASHAPALVVVADAAGHVHHRTTRTDIMGSSDTTAADAARLVDAAASAADAAASALPTRFDPFGLSSMIPPW
jgi:hypothetical protein